MPETTEARCYVVSGRVQGVGFRDFVRRTATGLGVVGWVRNCPDGHVEVNAAGALATLSELREALEKGPLGSRVERVREQILFEAGDWNDFEIRATG